MNIKLPVRYTIWSILFIGLLFSDAVSAAGSNLVSVNKAGAPASFSFETDSVDPVIEYHNVVHMLVNRDEQPTLRIYGDGRVKVHRPVYMKNAGDYEMQLSQQELVTILEVFSNDGLMEFDPVKTKQKKKIFDSVKKNQSGLSHISDSVTTQIEINLKNYRSVKTKVSKNNFKKRIRLKDIEQDIKRYKTIGEIQKVGNSINKLRLLLMRDELQRK